MVPVCYSCPSRIRAIATVDCHPMFRTKFAIWGGNRTRMAIDGSQSQQTGPSDVCQIIDQKNEFPIFQLPLQYFNMLQLYFLACCGRLHAIIPTDVTFNSFVIRSFVFLKLVLTNGEKSILFLQKIKQLIILTFN